MRNKDLPILVLATPITFALSWVLLFDIKPTESEQPFYYFLAGLIIVMLFSLTLFGWSTFLKPKEDDDDQEFHIEHV